MPSHKLIHDCSNICTGVAACYCKYSGKKASLKLLECFNTAPWSREYHLTMIRLNTWKYGADCASWIAEEYVKDIYTFCKNNNYIRQTFKAVSNMMYRGAELDCVTRGPCGGRGTGIEDPMGDSSDDVPDVRNREHSLNVIFFHAECVSHFSERDKEIYIYIIGYKIAYGRLPIRVNRPADCPYSNTDLTRVYNMANLCWENAKNKADELL